MAKNSDPIIEATLKALADMGAQPKIDRTEDHRPSVSQKGSGYLSTDDQTAGSTLNPQAQLGLFSKIRKQTAWARYIGFKPVSESTGFLDLWSDEGFKMHATSTKGPRSNIPLHKPDLSSQTFSTKTMSGAAGLDFRAIRSAARAGQNINTLIRNGIASGIGNVFLDLGINGDTSLPNDSDDNMMRRTVDGWLTKIRASGNRTQQDDGFSYHNRIWPGMLQQIDRAYRSDPGLAWLGPDELGTRWLTELTSLEQSPANSHPSVINALGQSLLNSATAGGALPLGKPYVVAPQIVTDGYGSEGYSGTVPTSVVNNGDGTLTINVNTLCGSGVDRSSTGDDGQRYVVVGRTGIGVEETLAVAFATPNNTVTTTSLLGQTNPSTTAADYYVKYADLTSLLLGPLKYLFVIVQNGIRIYTVFYPRDEVLEIIVHADVDYMVVDYDAFSLVDSIICPRFSILE